MTGRFVQQADGAEDAAHAPHVLIFQIGAVRPAQHQDGEAVGPGLKEGVRSNSAGSRLSWE
jgi:hypothetical protein